MAYSTFYNHFFNFRQHIAKSFANLWRFVPARFYLGLALLWQIISWYQASFIYKNLSGNLLVLHYNVDYGTDLIGDPKQIFYYPLGGLLVILLNLIVSLLFYRHKDFRLYANLLLGGLALFSIFLNLALLAIYLVNFR